MFGRVARMVRESERERERNAQSNKMKIHPSKLRKQGDGGSSSCCWYLMIICIAKILPGCRDEEKIMKLNHFIALNF